MKKRSPSGSAGHSSEFKGVVKKITGKLTSNQGLEREGREEMSGRPSKSTSQSKVGSGVNPDPHRRG